MKFTGAANLYMNISIEVYLQVKKYEVNLKKLG